MAARVAKFRKLPLQVDDRRHFKMPAGLAAEEKEDLRQDYEKVISDCAETMGYEHNEFMQAQRTPQTFRKRMREVFAKEINTGKNKNGSN